MSSWRDALREDASPAHPGAHLCAHGRADPRSARLQAAYALGASARRAADRGGHASLRRGGQLRGQPADHTRPRCLRAGRRALRARLRDRSLDAALGRLDPHRRAALTTRARAHRLAARVARDASRAARRRRLRAGGDREPRTARPAARLRPGLRSLPGVGRAADPLGDLDRCGHRSRRRGAPCDRGFARGAAPRLPLRPLLRSALRLSRPSRVRLVVGSLCGPASGQSGHRGSARHLPRPDRRRARLHSRPLPRRGAAHRRRHRRIVGGARRARARRGNARHRDCRSR